MNIRTERIIGIGLNIIACAMLVIMISALRSARDELSAEKVENRKLREAFAVLVEKSRWSCEIEEGERVICGVKEGAISRLILAEGDQVVSAKAVSSPLGKKKARRKR